METITGGGVFSRQNIDAINANFTQLFAGFTPGRILYCAPASSNTGPQSGSVSKPYTSLPAAYNATRNGKNDVVLLVGDGGSTGSARLGATMTWSNDSTHLIGIDSPVLMSQRARIAPFSTTTAFTPFFTVSGNGCIFQNIQWFGGFTTGTTAQIGMVLTGSRNYFQNCHIVGMGDVESAADAGSRTLKIGLAGSGENVFDSCTIGVDTITRSAANATVEFTAATARNVFRDCVFPFMTDDAAAIGMLGTGNGCVDRFNTFDRCQFINAIKSTSTTMTALLQFTTAAPGGMVIFKNCAMVGVTKFGDVNGLANSFLDMAAPSNSAGGLMVPPT